MTVFHPAIGNNSDSLGIDLNIRSYFRYQYQYRIILFLTVYSPTMHAIPIMLYITKKFHILVEYSK